MASSDSDVVDVRIEFLSEYIMKTMKLRLEKWQRMYSVEENKQMCIDFFEKSDRQSLIFSVNLTGSLSVGFTWPNAPKTKCVYFMKKANEIIGKEPGWKQKLIFGDIGHSPIQQLSVFVEEVRLHCLTLMKW